MVSSRDIDVLVKTGSRFFKQEVDTQTHKRYIVLESDGHIDEKNIFRFENGTKLRYFGKYANFANFGPLLRIPIDLRLPLKDIQQRLVPKSIKIF